MATAINMSQLLKRAREEQALKKKGGAPAPLLKKGSVNKRIEALAIAIRGCGAEECERWVAGERSAGDAYNPTHDYSTDLVWTERIENSVCMMRNLGATRLIVLDSTALKQFGETYNCIHGRPTLPKMNGIGGDARLLASFDLTNLSDAQAAQQVVATIENAAVHQQYQQ
ncbi:MAG TPA: hypothetical protein VGR37_15735 [Longimicrobiaceae bacterium]|nr:hypothetical protein [Longimicrobiaceae bacterium]